MSTTVNSDTNNTQARRNQVMLGNIPEDFLRVGGDAQQQQQMMSDERVAMVLQAQQQAGYRPLPANIVGKISITVAQAKLVKNYGLTKMDPYCRIRVGHAVFETPTAYNGAKLPSWNKVVQCFLPVGVDTMYIEIFDERSFTVDDRIAWAHVNIPQAVLNGDTVDDWFPLSGRQGDEKEGMINLVLTMTPMENIPQSSFAYLPVAPQPMFYPPMVGGVQMYQTMPPQQPQQQPQPQTPQGPLFTDEDLKQVKDMFPNMEEDVIKSVFEANMGNKDATINSLLTMND